MSEDRKKLDVSRDGSYSYSIYLEPDFENLSEALAPLGTEGRRVCIVADSTVASLYADELKAALAPHFAKISVFVFPAGEEYKTLDTVRDLYEHLILEKFDRRDMLAALGGGVTGDLTGFAAATYLRGIDFIQIPTTLLSQVDSSIGGKTGVDFDAYKNMVGAFHMPRLVYMNLNTLQSLPPRQFSSGMAEIVKHGLIQNSDYYMWLKENAPRIQARDYGALLTMVEGSCRIKRRVVEEYPTEQGNRGWLNFGHTIGHAVEKLKDFTLTHGECVAIGCVAAAWMSEKRGNLSAAQLCDIEETLSAFALPLGVEGLSPEEVLSATKSDKKMRAGRIRFVLLRRIGEAYLTQDVEDAELLRAIAHVCEGGRV
ncbi:MAG: 3-dehydroquinate synthase [Lachnospiraceae bacterium]|nr:3-dehydroquinate synthase [Lachnospiraceae bacterium]